MPYMIVGTLQQIAVAKNPVHTEVILILQVTAAAPFQDFHSEGVFSWPDKCCDVELRLKMASLRITHLLPVYQYKSTGRDALPGQNILFPISLLNRNPVHKCHRDYHPGRTVDPQDRDN